MPVIRCTSKLLADIDDPPSAAALPLAVGELPQQPLVAREAFSVHITFHRTTHRSSRAIRIITGFGKLEAARGQDP
jgi:hypothetical protein